MQIGELGKERVKLVRSVYRGYDNKTRILHPKYCQLLQQIKSLYDSHAEIVPRLYSVRSFVGSHVFVAMKVVIILAAFAAIIAHLLRTTVPEGLTEPWKYRLLVGTLSLQKNLVRLTGELKNNMKKDNR